MIGKKRENVNRKFGMILGFFLMVFLSFGLSLKAGYVVEAAETATLSTTEETTVYSTEEVSLAARQYCLDRVENFVINLVWNEALGQEEFEAIIDDAYKETSAGTEGDYLRENVEYQNISLSGQIRNGVYYYKFSFSTEYLTTAEEEEEVTTLLKGIYGELNLTGKSDVEKVRTIYDYITTHVEYDYSHLNDTSYHPQFTARACLVDGKAVCKGFSLLLYRMLKDQGIDCRIVSGNAVSDDQVSGSHAWNIVKLEDVYFYLDSTWDTGGYHDYFLYGSGDYDNHQLSDDYLTAAFTSRYPVSDVNYDTYIAQHPQVLTGWQEEGGKKYYYDASGEKVTGASQIDGKWYFFDPQGVMQTGWVTYNGRIYYFDEAGVRASGWKKIGGKYYRFSNKGVMLTGWTTYKGNTYYLKSDGSMAIGWNKIDGKVYGFNVKGVMQTGWITYKGNTFYLDTDGAMVTGWKKIDGKYYRFTKKGVMLTGWTTYKGNTYYLDETGAMAVNCTMVIDGTEYRFNKSGVCMNY